MLVYVFPGQGSQQPGMGAHLFDEFSNIVAKADTLLGYSIKELCLADKNHQLNQTLYTQPAIYIVNALMCFKMLATTHQKPDYVTGHSLGEYNALLAAEVFDFETGLLLVMKRAELMSQENNGAMAAIIGLCIDQIQKIFQIHNLHNITIANHNSPSQFVISGAKADIAVAISLFEKNGAKLVMPLKVSGAFHSPFMASAQKQFANFLSQYEFMVPTLPVLSSCTAKPYHPAATKDLLAKQISEPVLWTDTIKYLLNQGDMVFEEIGPGNVLTGLIRRIRHPQ